MYLIPLPLNITARDGIFSIDHNTAIILDVGQDDIDLETAKLLQQEIEKVIAIKLSIKKRMRNERDSDKNYICFEYDKMDGGKEAYRLIVTPN